MYHVNVGFKMFLLESHQVFCSWCWIIILDFLQKSSISFWIFFLFSCNMILKVYLPPTSYLSINKFYYFSKKATSCSYKHHCCRSRAVFSLWAPSHIFQHSIYPRAEEYRIQPMIRAVPACLQQGPGASKGDVVPSASLEREICSPPKMSCSP